MKTVRLQKQEENATAIVELSGTSGTSSNARGVARVLDILLLLFEKS